MCAAFFRLSAVLTAIHFPLEDPTLSSWPISPKGFRILKLKSPQKTSFASWVLCGTLLTVSAGMICIYYGVHPVACKTCSYIFLLSIFLIDLFLNEWFI